MWILVVSALVFFVLLLVNVIVLSVVLMRSKRSARNFVAMLLQQNRITYVEYCGFLGKTPAFAQVQNQDAATPAP